MHSSPLSRRRFLALSGAAGLGAIFPKFASGADREPVTALGKLVASNAAFALDLFRKLAAEKGNTFFSPFSISTALAMTSAGARGKTLDEMKAVLHLPDNPHATFGNLLGFVRKGGSGEGKHALSTANAVWGMQGYPWRKEFLELLKTEYQSELAEVDFSDPETTRTRINDWVKKETKDKIKELIPAGGLTPLNRLVLANAVYFKGQWVEKFNKDATQDAPFTHADGTKADVPMMARGGNSEYAEFAMSDKPGDTVQMLEQPYVGNKASMLFFLPKDHKGLDRVMEWLKPKHLRSGNVKNQRVDVYIPRFKTECAYALNPVLKDMGMKLAFDADNADLTGMHSGKEVLYISAVRHKAFVDVNEEGTEAAAATDVENATKSEPKPEVTEFRADHPFVFAIRDETTDAILFLGRYNGPKA
jgi:serpin B